MSDKSVFDNNKELEDFGVSSSPRGPFWKWQEGKNKFRVLGGGAAFASHYVNGKYFTCFRIADGCPYHGENAPKDREGNPAKASVKRMFYVLDKRDENHVISLMEMPEGAFSTLQNLAKDDEWSWDGSSFPMPYDLNIKFDSKTKVPKDKYILTPLPNFDKVPESIMEELAKMTPVEAVKEKKISRSRSEFFGNAGPSAARPSVAEDDEIPVINLEDEGDIKMEDIPF